MKFIFAVLLMQSFSVYAFSKTSIVCEDPKNSKTTYLLEELDYDHYSFKVVSHEVVDPYSCRSRWGCDYVDKTVFYDKLNYTDVQGAMVFESKRTYLNMEDMDDVSYTYTSQNAQGRFVEKTVTLKCQIKG